MAISIEWFGVATFRLTIDDLVIFLDAYIDRVPSAPPVGLRSEDVDRCDYVLVGHSHFDHLHGAQHIAKNTGAKVIGSHETCRVMAEHGVAKEQMRAVQGGEHIRLGDGVTVRVFPSLHSCTWSAGTVELGEVLHGDLGLTEDQRARKSGGLFEAIQRAVAEGDERGRAIGDHIATSAGSPHSGGALVYLIETREGTIFHQDTSGCWPGVLRELRADVVILAAAARGNYGGEPFQGSLAQFVAEEAASLQARTVIVGHHDDWMPPVTSTLVVKDGDLTPVRDELARVIPHATLLELTYNTPVSLLKESKMNVFHRWYCNSKGWAEQMQQYLPRMLGDADLGDDLLEVGPGPGVTTDILKTRVAHVTAVEIDHKLAVKLQQRFAGSNVKVIEGDATKMELPDNRFSGAVSFTMLHHVPSAELQDKLLSEVQRVLAPGGVFLGSDSVPSLQWNLYHIFDTRVPIDPNGFQARLERAGFSEARVYRFPGGFGFGARKLD